MAHVSISDVSVIKDEATILDHVSIEVGDGELLGILGPSGAGKTTLLRVVAGLDRAASGAIRIDGIDLTDIPSRSRDVAMVFQEAVFLPHLDVHGNVAFPLKIRKRSDAEIEARVGAETRALHIDGLLQRRPDQLSAGEQHLVQIARSMVRAPQLFLMDEPLARLDAATRERMRAELKMMQRGYGVTTLYVTNDPKEAMAVADRIVVLVDGAVEQVGTPEDLYERPLSLNVARLTGDISTISVEVEAAPGGGYVLVAGPLREKAWAPALEPYIGRHVMLGVRPEAVRWPEQGGTGAVVASVMRFGSHVLVLCRSDEWSIWARSNDLGLQEDDAVSISLAAHTIFDPATERTLVNAAS